MPLGLCASCGKLATQQCGVCSATICVACRESAGCKICHGRKMFKK